MRYKRSRADGLTSKTLGVKQNGGRVRLFSGATDRSVKRSPLYSTTHETAAVKIVTKASQWRKIGPRERRKGRGVSNLRITSFAGNSERPSFVRCTVRLRTILASEKAVHKYEYIQINGAFK
ncbi:hypothetical protein EVAR_3581_1 [Eumeta japonica]|uniref:Uncharacterized protein n=1 Tax=Eumeta variegata TaxID=151549 RepID=A0A4C1SVK5_EUMVA|nr:hypothetical protein EVAR_3581_1 [Eumeta japonica]